MKNKSERMSKALDAACFIVFPDIFLDGMRKTKKNLREELSAASTGILPVASV